MDKIYKYSKVITALLNVYSIKTEVIVVLLLFHRLNNINLKNT